VIFTEQGHRVEPGQVCFEDFMHDAAPSNNLDN
jgi:hypothetical protein